MFDYIDSRIVKRGIVEKITIEAPREEKTNIADWLDKNGWHMTYRGPKFTNEIKVDPNTIVWKAEREVTKDGSTNQMLHGNTILIEENENESTKEAKHSKPDKAN
jgi:hypothetical protein